MKSPIPKALQNPSLRFFLAGKSDPKWQKLPIEKRWNGNPGNNYRFFDERLLNHILKGGNYGVLGGFGNLIILDFDDWGYYKQIRGEYNKEKKDFDNLPRTFTVQTANKETYHKYYYLKGEMFKKIGVDILGKRVCDIQAQGSGVIGPESRYNRKYYTIRYNDPIATIEIEKLVELFNIQPKKYKEWQGETAKDSPEADKQALKILEHLKVERTSERHFKCPYHESQGGKSLHLFLSGTLYCFHCQKRWTDIQDFVDDYQIFKAQTKEKSY